MLVLSHSLSLSLPQALSLSISLLTKDDSLRGVFGLEIAIWWVQDSICQSWYHKKKRHYHALREFEESLSPDAWTPHQMNNAVEKGKDEEGRDHDANEDHQPFPTPVIVLHFRPFLCLMGCKGTWLKSDRHIVHAPGKCHFLQIELNNHFLQIELIFCTCFSNRLKSH